MLEQVHYSVKMRNVLTHHEKYGEGVSKEDAENEDIAFKASLEGRMEILFNAMTTVFRIVARKLDDITTKFEY